MSQTLSGQVSLASIATVSCNFFFVAFALLSLFLAFFHRPYVFAWYPTAAVTLFFTFDFSSGVANRIGIIPTNTNTFQTFVVAFDFVASRIHILLLKARTTMVVDIV